MKKFQNKYRIDSIRIKTWNYAWNAAYFITICTRNRNPFFGKFVDGQMAMSIPGKIAYACWAEIPEQFDFIELDEFVLMPNHVHGIIIINHEKTERRDAINRVSTAKNDGQMATNRADKTGGITGENNPMLQKNLSRVIRWFKGRVTYESRKIFPDFAWQARFYDHIVRDDTELNRIRLYIRQNPQKWLFDRQNPDFSPRVGESNAPYAQEPWVV
jgi:REP element-mobilizing transposase RayT